MSGSKRKGESNSKTKSKFEDKAPHPGPLPRGERENHRTSSLEEREENELTSDSQREREKSSNALDEESSVNTEFPSPHNETTAGEGQGEGVSERTSKKLSGSKRKDESNTKTKSQFEDKAPHPGPLPSGESEKSSNVLTRGERENELVSDSQRERKDLSTSARHARLDQNQNRKAERFVTITGAAQHNLQHIDVQIPRNRMNVFSGPSGSGKTSLAMETIYAEGQRRYVESLSAYARQFLGQMPKPRLDHIQGLSPAIAIEQKAPGQTPRSTVGTVTEIYDYLRVLYTRLGNPYCPECNIPIESQTTDEVIETVLQNSEGERILILAPQEVPVGHSYDELWEKLRAQGFVRVRINGEVCRLDDVPKIDRRRKHVVEIVVDRLTVSSRQRSRLADSMEAAFELGQGNLLVAAQTQKQKSDAKQSSEDWVTVRFSLLLACSKCHRSFEPLTPHNFSFNGSLGWCEACEGLGVEQGRASENKDDQLVRSELTLREGAISVWPSLSGRKRNKMFLRMAEAIAKDAGFSLDDRFQDLTTKHQRLLLQGTEEKWYSLTEPKRGVIAQFQYKGIYPAIEEASRVSYKYRQQLRGETDVVACSACRGSRLRDDAASVRLNSKTIHELCSLPLSEALSFLKKLKLSKVERKIAGELKEEAVSRLSFLVEVGLHYLFAFPTASPLFQVERISASDWQVRLVAL